MAIQRISDLGEHINVTSSDLIEVSELNGSTYVSKKMNYQTLSSSVYDKVVTSLGNDSSMTGVLLESAPPAAQRQGSNLKKISELEVINLLKNDTTFIVSNKSSSTGNWQSKKVQLATFLNYFSTALSGRMKISKKYTCLTKDDYLHLGEDESKWVKLTKLTGPTVTGYSYGEMPVLSAANSLTANFRLKFTEDWKKFDELVFVRCPLNNSTNTAGIYGIATVNTKDLQNACNQHKMMSVLYSNRVTSSNGKLTAQSQVATDTFIYVPPDNGGTTRNSNNSTTGVFSAANSAIGLLAFVTGFCVIKAPAVNNRSTFVSLEYDFNKPLTYNANNGLPFQLYTATDYKTQNDSTTPQCGYPFDEVTGYPSATGGWIPLTYSLGDNNSVITLRNADPMFYIMSVYGVIKHLSVCD